MSSKYTEESILVDALRFIIKRDWKQQSYRFYKQARERGPEFYARCMAHMRKGRPPVGPTKGKFKFSDAEIEAGAKLYTERGRFKNGPHGRLYEAGRRRHGIYSDFWKRITAHMEAPRNPYGGDIYAYVVAFEDMHAYVGISCRAEGVRMDDPADGHLVKGPVFRHLQKHPGIKYEFHVIEPSVAYADKRDREGYWQAHFISEGWTPLWNPKTIPGSLGRIPTVTKEQCAACARLCKERTEFLRRYQSRYKIAKKRGWYDEITTHMRSNDDARRELCRKLAARPVSQVTRDRQSAAKLGRKLSPEHRD